MALILYVVHSRLLELSRDREKSSSYREFEFSRSGFKSRKIIWLMLYFQEKNTEAKLKLYKIISYWSLL